MSEEEDRPAESDVVIELSNASVFHGKNLVLSDISLQIKKGEFVYLIGKTGSGKSSFLRTLYADLPLQKGEAEIAGFELQKIKRKEVPYLRRKLGIVFQDFQLLSDRSVHDNLVFVMKATGWKDKKKMEERIKEVLGSVGLETKGFKMPHQLSGGEQQRVSIARALVNHPEIILADEPTGNLDPETSHGILDLMKEINKTGTAVVFATHNYNLFSAHQARILKCENGLIIDEALDASSGAAFEY